MEKHKLKCFFISDIHLGHKRNKTYSIIFALITFFKKYDKLLRECDLIILVGDEYDRLVNSGTEEFNLIMSFFFKLARYCEQHNIILRSLEGTGSHCYKQMKTIHKVITESDIKVDFKYVDVLSIEHIDKLNIDVLYVPDEWNVDAKDTFKEIQELMKEKNLQTVDITALHGQFHYQLPVTSKVSHSESDFLSITKHYITAGHVHKHSVFKRILVQGSFDRLAHGEEEEKGAILAEIDLDNPKNDNYRFLVNEEAKIFKSLKIDTDNIEEYIQVSNRLISDYPSDSYISLVLEKNSPIKRQLPLVKKSFPNFVFTVKDNDNKDTNLNLMSSSLTTKSNHKIIEIRKENIRAMLLSEFANNPLTEFEMSIFDKELREVI